MPSLKAECHVINARHISRRHVTAVYGEVYYETTGGCPRQGTRQRATGARYANSRADAFVAPPSSALHRIPSRRIILPSRRSFSSPASTNHTSIGGLPRYAATRPRHAGISRFPPLNTAARAATPATTEWYVAGVIAASPVSRREPYAISALPIAFDAAAASERLRLGLMPAPKYIRRMNVTSVDLPPRLR